MDISWDARQLIAQIQNSTKITDDVLRKLYSLSNEEYLDAVACLGLDIEFTSAVFTTHNPIFVDICSRWLNQNEDAHLLALSALSRVITLHPYLSVFAKALLNKSRNTTLKALATRKANALQNLPQDVLNDLLIILYRLIVFDNAGFAECIAPAQMQSLLAHDSALVRFMAVRILGLYLHASDATLDHMLKRYVGQESVVDYWETRAIDYTFLVLWEGKRLEELARQLRDIEIARNNPNGLVEGAEIQRTIEPPQFLATTAYLGGVLVPRSLSRGSDKSSFIVTESVRKDLAVLARGLNSRHPLIVTGLEGSGKTSMIKHAARVLGEDENMITLHLNEQTDAKLLIGMYVNDKDTGHFKWKPGVLTKAVIDGYWLVIEDLDRAPTEILSLLLPLLERREIFVPYWGENIVAHPSFKLIATVRTSDKTGGEEVDPSSHLLGRNYWSRVTVSPQTNTALAEIVKFKSPVLSLLLPQLVGVYSALHAEFSKPMLDLRTVKPPGPREFLRWSARIAGILSEVGVHTSKQPISDATRDDIFLEAVDCFAASVAGSCRKPIIDAIGAELRIPQERMRYCLETRVPRVHLSETAFTIGRVKLSKSKEVSRGITSSGSARKSPFAISEHVSRVLESIAAAVKGAEPCLLVGETGAGKTAVLQKLAHETNKHLVVVNLSQQSESEDLLGGFKPTNPRSLAIPMRDEFKELLLLTFASKSNQQVIVILDQNIAKARWSRVLHIWRKALESVQRHLDSALAVAERITEEPQSKKRKLRRESYQQLQPRWNKFAVDLEDFEMQVSRGPKGFAFSFVEGSVVKAARNGDWVLLDEINLASPDTLESLADLLYCGFDGRPSVLLLETGKTERIKAHPDFRIFGAMNPATDTGKRDLPPSIRSRFSEYYIDGPDFDLKNLVPFVDAYLGNHTHSDVLLATHAAELYLKIKDLERTNALADGNDRKVHFSLRNLSRALNYGVDLAPLYGLRRALYEGFCMTFTTSLDKGSESLLRPVIQTLILGSLLNEYELSRHKPRFPPDGKQYVQFRHYWISKGDLSLERDSQYIRTPFVEHNLLNLVRAISTRKYPVLLQGPTSSGKTSMIEYLASISGNKFVRINNHEHTDLQEYLGSYVSGSDGEIKFQEGLLVQALKEGFWVVLDELNLAPTDVLEALNRLLDDNRELFLPDTQQVIRPHKNFLLFATQNPPGLYGGRKVLSRAFQNRFLELHFDDIPEDELETILRERTQIAPSFCKNIVTVYQRLSLLRQTTRFFEQRNSFATLRDLFRWALRDADNREQLAINGFLLLAERVRNADEKASVKKVIEEVLKVKIDEDHLYSHEQLERSLGSPLPNPQGLAWTKSMRRLYILVTQALKRNEPVLLVGHTGLGKTTICQVIAETMATKIHIVNAHQNMETSDLVGAQRPVRDKILIQEELAHDYRSALTSSSLESDNAQCDLDMLAKMYDSLIDERPENVSRDLRIKIQQRRSRLKTLFEWSDGSLVQAMRAGYHYLLDEISLADDSVLERLNSVLEPGRSLLLAEKGHSDPQIRALDGFQFLATMNPGGDYGKRELSPALRNRFTEIWVPTVAAADEMLEIVLAKLPPPRADLAKPMVDFAIWYSSRMDVDASISIRDLLSWAKFVEIFKEAETAFLAFHGAATVYLDSIRFSSTAGQTEGSYGFLPSLQKLGELFRCDVLHQSSINPSLELGPHHIKIGDFHLRRLSEENPNLQYNLQAPTTRLNAMKLVRALQLQKPILLEGSPGVGKSTLVSALAHAVGVPLTRINLSDQTDLMDLFGSDVPLEGESIGHFGWQDAPFLRAMQRGEWVLLDEMNLASQTVLEGLNACFDHRGEVFISELNKTFHKNADFVVFAAQNPQSQGGGRKGLPVSFVNRFTSVLAASFHSEDLQMICTELFKNVSVDVVKRLIDCLFVLNTHFDENPRLATSGGPWCLNLRDVLRWLQLLTSQRGLIHFANAVDFVDLLILQRIRNFEDRITVSKIIHKSLNHTNVPRTHYYALGPQLLQVGLATLPRDLICQPLSAFERVSCNTDPQNIESIMLCIQMNWPCLLVGPVGSGKVNVVRQIASCVGAELVTIALHPDMDTTDLVGGLEQYNISQELNIFVKRIRAYTEKVILKSIAGGNRVEMSALFDLGNSLDNGSTNKMQMLEAAARNFPSLEYPAFLQEYRILSGRAAVDERARFEWVDGILVQAIKRGKWLLMNNANLCEVSVLDRINSLLEPEGLLSINEHRNCDGSPQVVRPHPDFRLFITIDPRHGELSRAMRNRSVEIFMPAKSLSPTPSAFGLENEAVRFRSFQMLDWKEYDFVQFANILNICLQHLSVADFKLCSMWDIQILTDLIGMTDAQYKIFKNIISIYQNLLASRHATLVKIQGCYFTISHDLGYGEKLANLQSMHPFNNSILLSGASKASEELLYLGYWFDLTIENCVYSRKLESVSIAAGMEAQPAERSVILDFHQDLTSCLSQALNAHDFADPTSKGFMRFAEEVLVYLVDFLDSTVLESFNEAISQTYQRIGWALITRKISQGISNKSQQFLANQLASQLTRLNSNSGSWSGLAIEHLWSFFKPHSADCKKQFDMCMEIEALADRFDAVKWGFGASVHALEIVRGTLIGVNAYLNCDKSQTIMALEKAKSLLVDIERRSGVTSESPVPYFRVQFEMLNQLKFIDRGAKYEKGHEALELLADRPTKASMASEKAENGWQALSKLYLLAFGSQRGHEIAVFPKKLVTSTIQLLYRLDEVPLSAQRLLTEEIKILCMHTTRMCGTISSDVLVHMEHKLTELRTMVLEAFPRGICVEDAQRVADFDALHGHLNEMSIAKQGTSDAPLFALLRCSTRILKFDPSLPKSPRNISMLQLAKNWIQFFAGLLSLYVPDRLLDPAVRPSVELARHRKRADELRAKIDAMKTFQMSFSGQKTNYRIQLLQKSLESLGNEPSIHEIHRPAISGIPLLQNEFQNILNSILLRIPEMYLADGTPTGNKREVNVLETLRANIRSVSSRLSGGFREYDDITKPLLAMLQGLDIGLRLVPPADAHRSKNMDILAYVSDMTPFMNASPQSVLSQNSHDFEQLRLSGLDIRAFFLEVIGLFQGVENTLTKTSRFNMLECFHSFYQEWKEKFDQDQREKAAESSLYKYRGGHDEDEGIDSEDLLQIFQTYDGYRYKSISRANFSNDPKAVALFVSHLHRQIFQPEKIAASATMLRLLENVSHQIATLWSQDAREAIFPTATENLLPVLIQNLSIAKDALEHSPTDEKSPNFYLDPNVVEAEKVVALVQDIQKRFHELQQAWPEHATLEDVLRISKELLAFQNSVPVAKMLTKVEQLHNFVHEWQVVASREFTAVELFDRLTNLIIRWRRLELSSWGQLLDMEDKACKDDSDSWWFMAYEVIVAAPMSLINEEKGVFVYAQQLYTILEKFLAATSRGQYIHRLNLLKCFEDHLTLLAEEHKALRVIRSTLNNFLRFHYHFDESIQLNLREGRGNLEKDLKEVLLLASWKDTNIIALRDSAKRSHHKLFKIVRKYRALLAQPADESIRLGIRDPIQEINEVDPSNLRPSVSTPNTQALEFCLNNWANWNGKAHHLRNPTDTAKIMLQLSHYPQGVIDAATYLSTFTSDLVENMMGLRKETPSKSTLQNKMTIKHLKTRKRKLFSDTLKAVRQMGFRSNINGEVLRKQESTAAVFSTSPCSAYFMPRKLEEAEQHLDRFLDVMPRIRESALKHSDDLTHGEISRSIGYLESMLFSILKQRNFLFLCAEDLTNLTNTCGEMENLWFPDRYTIGQRDSAALRNESCICRQMKWLAVILEVGCTMLQTHLKLSESHSEEALTFLLSWKTTIGNLVTEILGVPKLPQGISSTKHIEVFSRCQDTVKALRDQLGHKQAEYPNLVYIFKQIEIWTIPSEADADHETKDIEVAPFTAFDESISGTVDSILVAVQHMRQALDSTSIAVEDARWLLDVDKLFMDGIEKLHFRNISFMIVSVMSQIPFLESADGQETKLANAICALVLPIIQQYRDTFRTAFLRYGKLHFALCHLASVLAKSFLQLVQEGFCSPREESDSAQVTDEKLEGGTGLGDGEGAEDISNGIEDDEDLTDLANKGEKDDIGKKEEFEDQEDAVNMDHDEMAGEDGDAVEDPTDKNQSQDGSDDEIDDEIGSVDELDPGAVDEKLWDGEGRNDEKDKENDNARGEAKDDQVRDGKEEETMTQDNRSANEENNQDLDIHQDAADETEEAAQGENEKLDPNTQEQQNLDLPEGMDLDVESGLESLQSEDTASMKSSNIENEELTENPENWEDDGKNEMLHDHEADEPDAEHEDPAEIKATMQNDSIPTSPVDTELDDVNDDSEVGQKRRSQDRTNESALEMNDTAATSETQGLGQDVDDSQDNDQVESGRAKRQKGAASAAHAPDEAQAGDGDCEMSEVDQNVQRVSAPNEDRQEYPSNQASRKMGDALDEFHKQLRHIRDAPETQRQDPITSESQNEQFEHLGDNEQDTAPQALGPTSSEFAKPLHEDDTDSEIEEPQVLQSDLEKRGDSIDQDTATAYDTIPEGDSYNSDQRKRAGAIIGEHQHPDYQTQKPSMNNLHDAADDRDPTEIDLPSDPLPPHSQEVSHVSVEAALQLWSGYEAMTQDLSHFLTEQLRLILTPTQATKMRGGFRTGKRLNIKRIIPYIASNFKQDKIWMRRSIPSKRNYQILLALDDSKSMSENGSGELAFQTLAVMTKSLSVLEVGEICIVGFGSNVFVAHEFHIPFTSAAGANVVQQFNFQQEGTNVANLVDRSVRLLRAARQKQIKSSQDLLQLQLIVSDGLCEDHEKIKRLVRQAMEERIMIVFVIVDALLQKNSIVDMTQAVFEEDPIQGQTGITIKRYLDGFPFTYYLVVGNVRDLPRVLAQALRQWFAEVEGI